MEQVLASPGLSPGHDMCIINPRRSCTSEGCQARHRLSRAYEVCLQQPKLSWACQKCLTVPKLSLDIRCLTHPKLFLTPKTTRRVVTDTGLIMEDCNFFKVEQVDFTFGVVCKVQEQESVRHTETDLFISFMTLCQPRSYQGRERKRVIYCSHFQH